MPAKITIDTTDTESFDRARQMFGADALFLTAGPNVAVVQIQAYGFHRDALVNLSKSPGLSWGSPEWVETVDRYRKMGAVRTTMPIRIAGNGPAPRDA